MPLFSCFTSLTRRWAGLCLFAVRLLKATRRQDGCIHYGYVLIRQTRAKSTLLERKAARRLP